ncbi:MAG TPA: class I SAM-dependent methyltransferase [Vicinamibacterales bacterium]|nr:class I SAM-dependent methyltransferase [Vicinamibacterales bacterium]
MTERRGHYSYTYYADAANAQSFDARRFGGPIGDLVARGQADVLADMLGPVQGRRIIDVGTGTGRGAFLLAAAGAVVTGIDASEQMLAIARRRAEETQAPVEFRVGDAHRIEFGDRSFDVAVSLRVLMHTPQWRQCIGELCRVAAHGVVLDYPAATSTALVQSMTRKLLHPVGLSSEPYRVFLDSQIRRELERHGYRITSVHRQFVLPIAVHKAIGSPRFTEVSERWLASLGLLRLFGSPVTVYAARG